MRRAVLYRRISQDAFAVKIDNMPGTSEVHCAQVHLDDPEHFHDQCIQLDPSTHLRKHSTSAPSPDAHQVIEVSLELGPYCMRSKAFIDCRLRYPRDPALETTHLESDDLSRPPKLARSVPCP